MSIKEQILSGYAVHFEPSLPETDRIVESEWIIEAITKNGVQVAISNGIMFGELILEDVHLKRKIELASCVLKKRIFFGSCVLDAPISLSNSTLEDGVEFVHVTSNATFNFTNANVVGNGLKWLSSRFHKAIIGNNAVFGATSVFSCQDSEFFEAFLMSSMKVSGEFILFYSVFHNQLLCSDSVFEKRVVLQGLKAASLISFKKCRFGAKVSFLDSALSGELELIQSTFHDVSLRAVKCLGLLACSDAKFSGNVEIFDGELNEQVTFHGASFDADINVNTTRFSNTCFFRSCVFKGNADFRHNYFRAVADFSGAEFKNMGKRTDFYGSQFSIDCNFVNTKFLGDFSFESVFIERYANFANAQFASLANFYGMRTLGAAFCKCAFNAKSNFMGAHFGSVNFEDSVFRAEANFNLSRFSESVTFDDAVFSGPAHFRFAEFSKRAGLRRTIFEADVDFAYASFRFIAFSKTGLVEGKEQFGKFVNLLGTQYEYLETAWEILLQKFDPAHYNREPFTHLENTLRSQGQVEAANDVYYKRRRIEGSRIKITSAPLSWLGNRILWILTGYGVKLERLIYAIVLVLAVGTFLFKTDKAVTIKTEGQAETEFANLSYYDSFWFTTAIFVPVDLPVARHWVPTTSPVKARWGATIEIPINFGIIATIIKLIGWILIPIGIAGLTGILKR